MENVLKQKALLIAGCIAATAPAVSVADVLPKNLIGLNLGEIRSSSFLNQPFKGVIPFLFTSVENSTKLSVGLASKSIFDKIGAEKHPILESLSFQVTQQNNKPVILISSNKPIQLPFLNFVLEIQGPEGVLYQDYTVLLDPASKQIESNNREIYSVAESNKQIKQSGSAQIANLASRTTTKNNSSLKYKVKSGDSLSKIAQTHGPKTVSLKTKSLLIYQKNRSAFIRGDVNRIKKGALISLPSMAEIKGFEIANNHKTRLKTDNKKLSASTVEKTVIETSKNDMAANENTIYTVVKGDSLSKITKKFITKDTSFTKMMNAIYTSNRDAFVNRNLVRAGAKIRVPASINTEFVVQSRKINDKPTIVIKDKITKNTEAKAPLVINNSATPSDLTKRIRELRKELIQAKNNLSVMQRRLGNKELLLDQKNIQLDSLNTALLKLKGTADLRIVPAKVVKTTNEIEKKKAIKTDSYKPISSSEMAKRKHDLLQKQQRTETLLKKADEIKSLLSSSGEPIQAVNNSENSFQKYSSLFSTEDISKANMAYLTAALLLGLLLIRYRRSIYAYTYSAINYEQPKYYPAPEAGSYELKEKNINYHDPKMDEDPSNYEYVSKEAKSDFVTISKSNKVEIDPLLVEATEDIFESNKAKEIIKDQEVDEEIQQCENLVTELFDEILTDENKQDDSDWQDIEKVCDDYIDQVKDVDTGIAKNDKGNLVDGATDFNDMMSDLLDSLGKVDKSVKKNKISDEDFPDILKFSKEKAEENHDNS